MLCVFSCVCIFDDFCLTAAFSRVKRWNFHFVFKKEHLRSKTLISVFSMLTLTIAFYSHYNVSILVKGRVYP